MKQNIKNQNKGEASEMKITIETPKTIETIRTKTGTYLAIQDENGNWVEIHLGVTAGSDLIEKVQTDINNVVEEAFARRTSRSDIHDLIN
tara:strand:+ start:200 stop:469 length:270 start_codon:yes stop_codon:yes gene_type:complete